MRALDMNGAGVVAVNPLGVLLKGNEDDQGSHMAWSSAAMLASNFSMVLGQLERFIRSGTSICNPMVVTSRLNSDPRTLYSTVQQVDSTSLA